MSDTREAPSTGAIGEVSFDPASGDLTGPTGDTRLAPQPSRLLELLLDRRGDVVTRAEIGRVLWPAGKVDADQGIAFAIREIRKGLETAGGDPDEVETIPRRGFRLRGALGTGTGRAGGTRRPPGRLWIAVAVMAGVVALGSLLRPAPIPVLVHFMHATDGDPEAERIAGSLATDLTTTLTAAFEGRLGIIGPTGASALAGPTDTDAARDVLGACLVLSGSLRIEDDDRVALFTQIVRTRDRVHVWAASDTLDLDRIGSAVTGVVEGVRASLEGC